MPPDPISAPDPNSEEFLEYQYLEDVSKVSPMSAEHIADTVHVMIAGDRARQRLMQSQLAMVVTIAREFRESAPAGTFLLDLVQQGNMALVLATNEVTADDDFEAFAADRVRAAIQGYLAGISH